MSTALVAVAHRVMTNWVRCRWCWRVLTENLSEIVGRTDTGFPKYRECGCPRSVKALKAWRESGMKGGIETGTSIVVDNFFGRWSMR